MELNKKSGIGVIVGRFQTPYLHQGHKDLIEYVYSNHEKIIIFIGVSTGQPTDKNPLDFETRKLMIYQSYPEATVLPIVDQKSDQSWSDELDKRIREIRGTASVIILYGGRDSFISNYKGKFKCINIEPKIILSATSIREKAIEQVCKTQDFRAGIIYGLNSRFPSPYICVDIACINEDKKEVLLAKKANEKGFRFIGGFVDSNDNNLKEAAKREFFEETGGNLEVNGFKIIGEAKIDDWRYKNSKEKIFTVLYKCNYSYGIPEPSDDIEYVEWISYHKLRDIEIEGEHKILIELLLTELQIPLS